MANIYDKEFDASKRLDRTIFRGSPNLFTTTDLNFQLENIRRDIKRSDWVHGALGSMNISTSYNTGNSKLTVTLGAYGLFIVGGIHTPTSTAQSLEITVGYNDPVYLFIEGTYSVKTYADDPVHGFVGAQFDDGTSMPAADQRVVENFAYHLARHDDEDPYWDDIYEDIDTKFCFLIAKIVQIDATTAYIYKNFASDLDTPMMNPKPYINEITALDSEKELVAGDPFDVAISKLIKKDALRKSDITSLLSRPYINESVWHEGADTKWIIRNNVLFLMLNKTSRTYTLQEDKVSLATDGTFGLGVDFQDYIQTVFENIPWTYEDNNVKQKFLNIAYTLNGGSFGLCISHDLSLDTWSADIGYCYGYSTAEPSVEVKFAKAVFQIPLSF